MKRLPEIEVLPKQADLVECEKRFMAAGGGVGSGKTFGAQLKMFNRLRSYPYAFHTVVGADFEQLRGGYFNDFRILLEDVLNWREGRDYKYRDNPRPLIVLNDSGASLRALSSELQERVRSLQIQSLHAEEPQTWHNGEVFWRTLVERIRHSVRSKRMHPNMPRQAWMTFNPTNSPVGSWLHELVENKWKDRGYPYWRFDLEENYLLADTQEARDEYIQNIKDNWPPHMWPVEINGHWPTSGGGVYRGFDRAIHGVVPAGLPPLAIDPTKRLRWTLDFNVEWMASVVAQVHKQTKTSVVVKHPDRPPSFAEALAVAGWQEYVFYALDEFFLPDSGAEDVAVAFLGKYGEIARKTGVVIYGDPSGNDRDQALSSTKAARSNFDIIIKALLEANIRVEARVEEGHPHVWDTVNMVNSQFRTGKGYGTLVNLTECKELVDDWVLVKKKEGENAIDKSDKSDAGLRRTHTSDAWRYFVSVEKRIAAGAQINFRQFDIMRR